MQAINAGLLSETGLMRGYMAKLQGRLQPLDDYGQLLTALGSNPGVIKELLTTAEKLETGLLNNSDVSKQWWTNLGHAFKLEAHELLALIKQVQASAQNWLSDVPEQEVQQPHQTQQNTRQRNPDDAKRAQAELDHKQLMQKLMDHQADLKRQLGMEDVMVLGMTLLEDKTSLNFLTEAGWGDKLRQWGASALDAAADPRQAEKQQRQKYELQNNLRIAKLAIGLAGRHAKQKLEAAQSAKVGQAAGQADQTPLAEVLPDEEHEPMAGPSSAPPDLNPNKPTEPVSLDVQPQATAQSAPQADQAPQVDMGDPAAINSLSSITKTHEGVPIDGPAMAMELNDLHKANQTIKIGNAQIPPAKLAATLVQAAESGWIHGKKGFGAAFVSPVVKAIAQKITEARKQLSGASADQDLDWQDPTAV